MFWYKFFQTLLWVPSKLVMPTKVVGKKNLPNGGAVLICNHQSVLDIPTIGLNIYKQQRFLGKKELFEKKSKARIYKSLGGIPIDRQNPGLDSIKQCLSVLKSDQRLLVFPEGTRKQQHDLQDFKSGAIMFAIKAKKPIVPMWIDKKPKFFRFNTLRIGKPIYFDEYFGKKLSPDEEEQANKLVLDALAELKSQAEAKNKRPRKSRKTIIETKQK